jgi:hypothetical protein
MGGAAAAVTGLVLHVLGNACHSRYLQFFGIDPGVFTKSIEWQLMKGYDAFLDRSLKLLQMTLVHWHESLIIFGAAFCMAMMIEIAKRHRPSRPPRPWWLQALGRSFAWGLAAPYGVPILIITISLIVVWPGLAGEDYGADLAQADLAIFKAGCQQANPRYRCITVDRDGMSLSKGFLIDGSDKHLALYDVNLSKAIVLEREHITLITEQIR